MTALYMLIPVAIVIVGLVIWLLFWAVNNGQYDDLDGPAHSILFDDEEPSSSEKTAVKPTILSDANDAPLSQKRE